MTAARPARAALDRLLKDYAPRPGAADEMLRPDGSIRPVWRPLLEALAALDPAEAEAHFARADQYLRDAGVQFRRYENDAQSERDWPLSHLPILLGEDEWTGIAAGLVQRAELLERVMADLYGRQRLIADGHLPARLIAESPEFLHPMIGIAPASGHYLHLLAFEIGRSPDGGWFVLGDRTQAPSGAGFALENRMATAQAFPDLMARANVHRLAGFFGAFRAALEGLSPPMQDSAPPRTRPAILTPGQGTDTYFEHAYIARYLGLLLLEGEDLTVVDDRLMVRTVGGLLPVPVLWRRLDSAFADPLELNDDSRIGTPGLVSALRGGQVAMVNALGAGVLETRALMAFLPRIAEVLTGAPLALPNIATWWCGQDAARDHVARHADQMVFAPALSCALPHDAAETLAPPADRGIAEWLASDGPALAAQQAVALSSTPMWDGGRLVPRPATIRVFAARTAEGWTIMPGGYARIARTAPEGGNAALRMQGGGAVSDVWILSDGPVPQDTLIAPRSGGAGAVALPLPSRAADNLFWLGRYLERTEGTIRLLRAWHLRLSETGDPEAPHMQVLSAQLALRGIDPAARVPGALLAQLSAAELCAGKLRDRLSPDAWTALRELSRSAREMAHIPRPRDGAARAMTVLLRRITGFAGLVHENMYRSVSWRFLTFGRALERADHMTLLLESLAAEDAPPGCHDIALDLGDSVMTHRRLHNLDIDPATLFDLLALDPANPRSLLFQLDEMLDHARALPRAQDDGRLSALTRRILELQTLLRVSAAEEITSRDMPEIRETIREISALLTTTYLG
ncbi:circularly permuted type 2 ATP-grasp protein [Pseudooceanicola aestuarii]|uniref:circularly permuted type 2 ATP-grasp protein n=1 Tax=Pseudooceanicola aestuarii TaxID=2697319 RepID=UPI0013CF6B20|nr:circularly permuted type 2 ATP-grasp protein [Pseudooceanicola aestuarii]